MGKTKGLIGRKIGMTSLFTSAGEQISVTVINAGPCLVTQIKTVATDGYNSIQLAYGDKKENKVNKPMKGHFEKSGGGSHQKLKEFRINDTQNYKLGQSINVTDVFEIGEKIKISGTTKGRGFSGVIKRHGFHGGKKTHGSMSHRIPGSIGCSATPSRVIKGKKLPGQYGNSRQTVKNIEIVDIRPEHNLILIKGAVPGCNKGIVELYKQSA
ncbi:MAG: large subunit ribosomal protein L3 [Candidatus Magnetoglobus multicellularis str. Araruama]|uniref:Large ribosomal subunit protein uL3 n=1 Tax=Candidatus Magnetoglobus multicellularis str. Araruama TaxID=890399 RepID=A0A1V1PHW8_9BACT|nr:MAG: large subunit ribosomal protein L3 [Candidatus Magnetoglobus multicellularis str. Araruama]